MEANWKRRRLLVGIAGWLVAGPLLARELLEPTPRQPAGPFYPVEPPLDDDNDLTWVRGNEGVAQGQIADLRGRLRDRNGRPISRARVEIWQCDANGRYRHPRDPGRRPVDPHFQGFGHTLTDAEGRYRFRTIRPAPYPGRTPHIHVAVFPEGQEPFITQIYVKGEPRNEGDFLFRRVPVEKRPLVLADFVAASGDAGLSASFDIVLGGMPAA